MGLLYLFAVQANDEDALIINHPLGGTRRYIEVAPLYFEEVEGDGRVTFREDDQGNVAYLFFGDLPQIALRKVAWYETRLFNLGLIGVTALLFLSVLVVGLVRLIVGLFRRRAQPPLPALARIAPAALAAMAVVGLALEIGLFLAITDSWALASGQRDLLTVTGWLSILAVLLAIIMVVLTVLAWRAKWWRLPARIYYTIVSLGSVALVWFLVYWNQLGWQWW